MPTRWKVVLNVPLTHDGDYLLMRVQSCLSDCLCVEVSNVWLETRKLEEGYQVIITEKDPMLAKIPIRVFESSDEFLEFLAGTRE
jgi:hypothetical protein